MALERWSHGIHNTGATCIHYRRKSLPTSTNWRMSRIRLSEVVQNLRRTATGLTQKQNGLKNISEGQ